MKAELFDLLPDNIIKRLEETPVIILTVKASDTIAGGALCYILRQCGLKITNKFKTDGTLEIIISNENSN